MKLLLAGEDRNGSLLRSLEVGLRESCELMVLDPAGAATRMIGNATRRARVGRRLAARHTSACFLEAVEQLRPDVAFIVKGRGIDAEAILRARTLTRVVILYPDNPFWNFAGESGAIPRLAAADMTVVWSNRLRDLLGSSCRRVETVPFGYDDSWFPLTDPTQPRGGVAFVGTWNRRRERYLRALVDLPLTIVGTGWDSVPDLATAPPAYGASAGSILQRAAIGVNIFHPHNAGAHNMRTRELAACGAMQVTDPGIDGTPLRDMEGCRWFHSPDHLRELVAHYLAAPEAAHVIARRAQQLVGEDTYRQRSSELIELFHSLV